LPLRGFEADWFFPTVLTRRYAHLLAQEGMTSEHILALTFTEKAATEMEDRVLKLLETGTYDFWISTFHGFCQRILEAHALEIGLPNKFRLLTSTDAWLLLKRRINELPLDHYRPLGNPVKFLRALLQHISRAKDEDVTPEKYLDFAQNVALDGDGEFVTGERARLVELANVYFAYRRILREEGSLDMNDLIMETLRLFRERPAVLEKYRKQFKYIMVDEYQDTNQAQYLLLSMLAAHRNIFVVGDDAQSIYKFRGSDITNILNFEKDYPEALVIKLEQNYRSTKNILEAAQKVIELNPEQKPKTLWTENPQGEKIILTCEEDECGEAEFVARNIVNLATGQEEKLEYQIEPQEVKKTYSILDRFIKAKKMQAQYSASFGRGLLPQMPKTHEPLKEYAVLYRTHAQSRALEEALIEASIPYQIVGGLKFYERKEIKDMLAYLRLVVNFRDLVSLKRVINEPPRGIGDKSYGDIRDFILNLPNSGKDLDMAAFEQSFAEVKLQPKALAGARDFFGILKELTGLNEKFSLSELMKQITRKTGYEKYIRDGSEKGESRWENVEELLNVAHKFNNLPWRQALQEFLEEVALLAEIDQKDDQRDVVTLMTLHSAKGLEFDNVFFVGLEEGILPHSRSLINPDELSEEVRLAYVGLTRARKRLFLVYTHNRRVYGNLQINTPSRILRALPRSAMELKGRAKDHFREDDIDGNITVEEMEY
jgi:DNA helicase-2/ATP-dependent DNA helicase PcrA